MKIQWSLLLALIFALIVAIFAVVNVEAVQVDYVFGTTDLPLIIIILGSALSGGLIVGAIGLFRNFVLQRQAKSLLKEKLKLEGEILDLKEELLKHSNEKQLTEQNDSHVQEIKDGSDVQEKNTSK